MVLIYILSYIKKRNLLFQLKKLLKISVKMVTKNILLIYVYDSIVFIEYLTSYVL